MNTDEPNLANEPVPQFYTIEAVAKILQLKNSTILRYINRKENPLPAIYTSERNIRIPIDQFEIWLKNLEDI